MLKMTCTREEESRVTFKLEGRITQPWIDVLLHECTAALSQGRRVIFDMTDVSFIDRSSVGAFGVLMRNHVELVGCSPFLSALLECEEKSFQKSNHRKKEGG